MDNEVIIITSCLRTAADFWERTNISQHCCQMLWTYTIAMIIFSVVMDDKYCQIPLPITFGYTTSPSEILYSIFKLCQICRKPQPCWQCVFKPQHNLMLGIDPEAETSGAEPCCRSFLSVRHNTGIHLSSFSRLICLCQAGQNINVSTEPAHGFS